MNKYEVEITEYLQRRITVEADSEADAVSKVEEDYNTDKEVLDYSDHTGTDIEIYNPNKFISKFDLLMDRIDKYNRDCNESDSQVDSAEAISVSASDLLECYKFNDNVDLNDVEEKLADVMNYCLQMSMFLKLDPIEIINNKMDKKKKNSINKVE
jgi:NTP pyrophosphatase (non-canonical NTP hydrolase)